MKMKVSDNGKIVINVPLNLRIHGARKLILLPQEAQQQLPPPPSKPDDALIKAISRAFRWKRMIEKERMASMAEVARKENVTDSYVTRILRLTLLAPDIIEAIFQGKQPKGFMLAEVLKPFPLAWEEQRKKWGFRYY